MLRFRAIDVFVMEIDNPTGKVSACLQPVMTEIADGAEPTPTLRLHDEEAQALMDDLWAAGIRPTEAAGSAGAMAAVQEHLKDLRRIVFDEPPAT